MSLSKTDLEREPRAEDKAGVRARNLITPVAVLVAVVSLTAHLLNYAAAQDAKPGEKAGAEKAEDKVLRKDHIQTGRFELLNDAGKIAALLAMHPTDKRCPVLNFYDKDGTIRLTLCLNPNGHPIISFMDAEQKQRMRLYLGENQNGTIEMLNAQKKVKVALQAGEEPSLRLFQDGSRRSVDISLLNSGPEILLLGDKDGAEMRIKVDGEKPSIVMKDPAKKEVFRAP